MGASLVAQPYEHSLCPPINFALSRPHESANARNVVETFLSECSWKRFRYFRQRLKAWTCGGRAGICRLQDLPVSICSPTRTNGVDFWLR